MEQLIEFIQNHPILSFGWIALFIAIIYLTIRIWFSKVKEIDTDKVTELINKENGVIVDIRNEDAFKKGRIANSINLLPVDIRNENTSVISKYKSIPIIVVCENGVDALKPAEELSKQGFLRVYFLKNGISGWRGNNLPLISNSKRK